ncbi:uncharacterized protein EKO05_0002224 [Ascochyta rabiei]|uniref:uncharacterized protein n=1 Tax=Didymella rabiei TaxID=5454 RepID=UPI00220C313F|nr:uncharacterized protein EKO05_0002224 [Ascochyta rabiei]UPX11629.1 hypothetical protein EKO05_0002224 [Ascochyta rabiei]
MLSSTGSDHAAGSVCDTKPSSVNESDGALLAGAHGRPGRREGVQRSGQHGGSGGELGRPGRRCKRRADAKRVETEHEDASQQDADSESDSGNDDKVQQADDGLGGLTDAAGRSEVQSRDFVVVRSATRVDWPRGRQDAALVLPTRADTCAHQICAGQQAGRQSSRACGGAGQRHKRHPVRLNVL